VASSPLAGERRATRKTGPGGGVGKGGVDGARHCEANRNKAKIEISQMLRLPAENSLDKIIDRLAGYQKFLNTVMFTLIITVLFLESTTPLLANKAGHEYNRVVVEQK
jgi:hypothetical protein